MLQKERYSIRITHKFNIMVTNNEDAVRQLQNVKVFLQNTACDASAPPTVVSTYLSLIDGIQLFLCPQANLNAL